MLRSWGRTRSSARSLRDTARSRAVHGPRRARSSPACSSRWRHRIWGESAPEEPFYLYGESGELKLELGIADEQEERVYLRIHKLAFDIDGREAPAGYRLRLPDGAFHHPPVQLDQIVVRTASPLALYQLRAGIASRGSFGRPSPVQQDSARRLKQRFFPGRFDADLEPEIESLT